MTKAQAIAKLDDYRTKLVELLDTTLTDVNVTKANMEDIRFYTESWERLQVAYAIVNAMFPES